jgi:hypothetical protein
VSWTSMAVLCSFVQLTERESTRTQPRLQEVCEKITNLLQTRCDEEKTTQGRKVTPSSLKIPEARSFCPFVLLSFPREGRTTGVSSPPDSRIRSLRQLFGDLQDGTDRMPEQAKKAAIIVRRVVVDQIG